MMKQQPEQTDKEILFMIFASRLLLVFSVLSEEVSGSFQVVVSGCPDVSKPCVSQLVVSGSPAVCLTCFLPFVSQPDWGCPALSPAVFACLTSSVSQSQSGPRGCPEVSLNVIRLLCQVPYSALLLPQHCDCDMLKREKMFRTPHRAATVGSETCLISRLAFVCFC